MEDWWDDIDPGELDTDFLTNNIQNLPKTPILPSPPHKLTTSTPLILPPAKHIPPEIPNSKTTPSPVVNPDVPAIDSFSSTFKSHLYNNTKSRHSISMTSSHSDTSSPIVIFADTREVSSSQILSSLRIKHDISVHVFSLKQCSFLVSSRLAVDRQNISDLSQTHSTQRVIDRARSMCEFYERCSIIIEKDRVKPKLQDPKMTGFARNQTFLTNLARLSTSRLSVLFSGSEQDTVDILVALSRQEAKRGHKIIGTLSRIDTPLFKFFNSIPKISPTISLKLVTRIWNVNQLAVLTPGELKKQCSGITEEQINSIKKFFSHHLKPTSFNQYKTKS